MILQEVVVNVQLMILSKEDVMFCQLLIHLSY